MDDSMKMPQERKWTRVEKIKWHFKRNKRTYISCAGTAVVAVVGTLIAMNNRKGELVVGDQDITQILSWKPLALQTVEVHVEALGDPGNIIQDDTTGTIYASQNQAARELGINRARISENLSGKLPTVNGHSFTKLGKAMVSED